MKEIELKCLLTLSNGAKEQVVICLRGDKPRIEKEIVSIDIDRPLRGWCPDDFLGKEFFVIRFK